MSTYSEESSDQEVVYDLSSPQIVDKYKAAGVIANTALMTVVQNIAPGVNVFELCELGDETIRQEVAKSYTKQRKMKKGIAFPTSISVNNCVGHYSPVRIEDSIVLAEGDVVKIDLGVHIDGFISVCAHTIVVNSDGSQITGPVADVVCAAYFAHEMAHRLIKPGNTNTMVTNAIQRVAECYNVNPVQGVLSHQMTKGVIDGDKCIIGKPEIDQVVDEIKFEVNEVYTIDIVMSTGEGKTREGDIKTSIYKKTPVSYTLRGNHARYLFNEVTNNHQELPFNIKYFEISKARMGAKEMLEHDLLQPYPVVYEKNGEIVAQFKSTLLVLPNSTQRLNEGFPLPFVSSELTYEGDESLVGIMNTSTQRKKRKRRR
eukprot:TRINITY_DN12386_c0_g1_i1.p1 TRINITY_DN12386_c0_g1~~TRINITY_DN12386_c0_g1_i1.p1  ORF type:complete len:372 (+),score=102.26 TRINITY_DN12386_c0_g1_i1:1677-2792(+)